MQFERLRKSHKKQIIIGALAICVIGGALTFSLTRAKYEIANDLEVAKGTINYKAYDFKIMAMYKSDDKTNYTEIEEMPSEGYTINESKSYCNMSNGNTDTNAILKTIDGNHIISKLKKNDRCYLYFDKNLEPSEETLAKLKITNVKSETPDFSKVATSDEGVFITDDPMYGTKAKTYYWRGAATTNYLKFGGFCWRIVRINGDGSLRLIYDGNTCHQNGESTTDNIVASDAVYNTKTDRSEYVGWTYVEGKQRPEEGDTAVDSNAKIKTEEWYNNNIRNNSTYDSKIVKGKFCNDRNKIEGYNWTSRPTEYFYYASFERLITNKIPKLNCSVTDVYNLKIGAITADEVALAGGVKDLENLSYYLYNSQFYWTMSPFFWIPTFSSVYVFCVYNNGNLAYNNTSWTSSDIRPVINLRSDVIFSGGDGTLNNPYIVAN